MQNVTTETFQALAIAIVIIVTLVMTMLGIHRLLDVMTGFFRDDD
jgi:Na+/proline symporter